MTTVSAHRSQPAWGGTWMAGTWMVSQNHPAWDGPSRGKPVYWPHGFTDFSLQLLAHDQKAAQIEVQVVMPVIVNIKNWWKMCSTGSLTQDRKNDCCIYVHTWVNMWTLCTSSCVHDCFLWSQRQCSVKLSGCMPPSLRPVIIECIAINAKLYRLMIRMMSLMPYQNLRMTIS